MQPIPEYSGITLDKASFDTKIVTKKQPIVFRGLAAHWRLIQDSNGERNQALNTLIDHANNTPCYTVVAAPELDGRFFYSDDLNGTNFKAVNAPFNQTLRQIKALDEQSDKHAISIQAASVLECLPDLRGEICLPILDIDVEPTVWVSNRSRVAAHFDLSDNIACVAAGRRRFVLFPPEQVSNLYVGPSLNAPGGVPISMVDLADPDLQRFPNFSKALDSALVAELDPGDAIFIPSPWWHTVESLDNINVLVNYWWNSSTSSSEPNANHAMMLSLLTIANMDEKQRLAWKAFFDYFVFKTTGDPALHLPPDLRDLTTEPSESQRQMCFKFLKEKFV